MSVRSVKLNKIGSGKSMKMFSLAVSDDGEHFRDEVYYGDIEPNDSMAGDQPNNKYNLYNFTNRHVISNLYPASKLRHRSTVLKYNKSTAKGGIDDYIEMELPQPAVNIVGFAQADDYVYALNSQVSTDCVIPAFDFSTMQMSSTVLPKKTYLYRPVEQDGEGSLSTQADYVRTHTSVEIFDEYSAQSVDVNVQPSALYNVFRPYFNLSGVTYNYVLEIPQAQHSPFYESEAVLANAFSAKNDLNFRYDMDLERNMMSFQLSDEAGEDLSVAFGTCFLLKGTRDYFDIQTCGGTAYLKYYDSSNWIGAMKGDLHQYARYDDPDAIVDITMTSSDQSYPSFQKVETIESVNRFKHVQHKSNMYSLKIHDSGVAKTRFSDDEEESERIRQNIMQDVENNARRIQKKLCPANTEMLKIYWTGE